MKKTISAVTILLAITMVSLAQDIRQIGPNYFVAGVPSQDFEYRAVDRQRSQNWCWAACVQMVLNYHGLDVSQEDVVMRCYGRLIDHPGGDREMFTALSGTAPNEWGGRSYIHCQNYISSPNEITNLLAYHWPLIVGLRTGGSVGHAYCLTAIYYYTDQWNNTVPERVVLRDPWPDNNSRQEMSWNEFSRRVNSIYKVWVTY